MAKKQAHCDPGEPADAQCGDYWDHVAYDPEHRLVLAVVPGARTVENAEALVGQVKRRLGGRAPELLTSDEYPAYAPAIEAAFGQPMARPAKPGPGRPRIAPRRRLPRRICYAIVRKHRENNRVVAVDRVRVFGTEAGLDRALRRSSASHRVNTSFLERQNGADRGRNARKARRTYRFSKDWQIHEAVTYLTMYGHNFCWPVRTLRRKVRGRRGWQQRTGAMAAGLADHVWTWREWFTRPAVQSP